MDYNRTKIITVKSWMKYVQLVPEAEGAVHVGGLVLQLPLRRGHLRRFPALESAAQQDGRRHHLLQTGSQTVTFQTKTTPTIKQTHAKNYHNYPSLLLKGCFHTHTRMPIPRA